MTLRVDDHQVESLSEGDIEAGILPRFADVVRAQPDSIAVADETSQYSYAELAARAARELRLLRETVGSLQPAATRRGAAEFEALEPVGILFGHHPGAVSALLAVLASGHPVLVLDQRTPPARLRQLVELSGTRVILTDGPNEPLARELVGVAVRTDVHRSHDRAETLWDAPPDPRGVAAIAFTSGSTGVPKPVANDHRLLMRDAWNSSVATGCYNVGAVVAHTLPIAFHAGLTTTVHGLVVGACLRLYDTRSRGVSPLPGFIAAHGAHLMITSPGILRALVDSRPAAGAFATLTSVTIAGESAYGRDVEAMRALLPRGCVIRNRYGSTETGLIAEYVIGPDHPPVTGRVPVGRGVGRTVLSVAAEADRSQDGTGSLVVTAPVVATGYWGLPERTAEAFGRDGELATYRTSDVGRVLPDGTIELVGRSDHSIKIRGHLVDPGEVEAALHALPGVREAAVTGGTDPAGTRNRLLGYVVAAEAPLDGADVCGRLRTVLPAHMVPEQVMVLEAMPRNDRGKIDRAALPLPSSNRAPVDWAVVGEWEGIIATTWMEVLGLPGVASDDDFFALGGDSIAAEEILTRLIDRLGVSPEVARTGTLAEYPRLRDFARRLQRSAQPARALVTLHGAGTKAPLFCVAGGGGLGIALLPLARALDPSRPVYALQSPVIESRGWPEWRVRTMAKKHVALVRSVQPHGPYHLAGHSFGGIVAFEMAKQLRAAGETVAALVILDSFPPDPRHHPPYGEGPLALLRSAVAVCVTAWSRTPGGAGAYRFWEQSRWLGRRYRGGQWDGRTLVVVAESPQRSQRAAWAGSLSGEWDRCDVGGDHITMLREPFVNEVAAHVQRFLTAAEFPAAGDYRQHAPAG